MCFWLAVINDSKIKKIIRATLIPCSFSSEKYYESHMDDELYVLHRTIYYLTARGSIKHDVISQGIHGNKLTFHSVLSIVPAAINQDKINGR